jgi:hypothetical protein
MCNPLTHSSHYYLMGFGGLFLIIDMSSKLTEYTRLNLRYAQGIGIYFIRK